MPRTGSSFGELTSGLSTDELVKRLKACHNKLDQDSVNSADLQSLAESLIQPFLSSHRSQEVRAQVACCIANVFRVSYPHPPYDEPQRKAVFSIFIDQLRGLEKPTSPAFKHSFRLLETLANIGLFNLCIELEDQDILTDVFKVLFSIINDEQSSKVRGYFIDILSGLVQGGDSLPQEVIDIILANILEPNKSENKAAYSFTVDFIRKTSSHIEPYIHLFFNNALVAGKESESEVIDHLYELILELHAIDSSVLLAVMPQLEFKLKSTDVEERCEVTKLLGAMFAPKTSKLAAQNKSLWNGFLGRFSDISPHIRIECVRHSKFYLLHHPTLVEDVTSKLHDRFYDKEERVRMEVVKVVCDTAAGNFDAIPKILCDDLEGRMRDKVWVIRKETVSNLAKIYRQIMSSSFSSGGDLSSSSLKRLHWIPTKILHSYYRDTMEDKLCVERCLLSCIVPISLPDQERMERMVQVYNSLSDDHAVRAFDHLLESRYRIRGYLHELIEVQQDKKLEEDSRKQAILTRIIQLTRHFPDSHKCQPYLDYLVKSMDNDKLRENLLKSIDTSCSCAEVVKAKGAVIEAVRSKAGLLDTVRNLLDRACPMLIDSSCIEILVDKVCTALGDTGESEEVEFEQAKKALQLVKVLSGIMPANFSSSEVLDQLTILLEHADKSIVRSALQILTLIGSHVDQRTASCFQPILIELALEGDPLLTKDTIKCLHKVFGNSKSIMEKLFSGLLSRLDYGSDHFATVLISLAQMAKLQPKIFATKHKSVISECVIKRLVCMDREDNETVTGEWAEDDALSYETKMKVLGIKLLVNWLLGLALSGSKELDKKSTQVLQLLDFILAHDGDLQAEGKVSPCACSRLRLASARGLLKLAKCPAYRDLIPLPMFLRLALTVQDPCEEVREKFMDKLNKYLLRMELSMHYLSIMVYAGIEPNKAYHAKFRKMLSTNILKRRQFLSQHPKAKEKSELFLPEYAVSHAIYLVSHHQEFSRTSKRKLDTFKECLWFFLEPMVVRGENFGLLEKLLATIKQTVDAQEPSDSEANKNLYAACDLAAGIMASKLPHTTGEYSGEVILSKKLFKPSGKPNTTRYLPPEYDCTPAKRLKVDVVIGHSASESTRAKSPTNAARKVAGKKGAAKPPTKVGGKGKKAAVEQATMEKKGGRGRKRQAVAQPVEDQEEEEEDDVEQATTGKKGGKGRKRRAVAQPAEDEEEEEEEDTEQATTGKKGGRGRKRRAVAQPVEYQEEEEEEEDMEQAVTKSSEKRGGRGRKRGAVAQPVEDEEEEDVEQAVTGKKGGRGRKRGAVAQPVEDQEEEEVEEEDTEQAVTESSGKKGGRGRKRRAVAQPVEDQEEEEEEEDMEQATTESSRKRGGRGRKRGTGAAQPEKVETTSSGKRSLRSCGKKGEVVTAETVEEVDSEEQPPTPKKTRDDDQAEDDDQAAEVDEIKKVQIKRKATLRHRR